MGWICPNCSSPNDDEKSRCFVCGMDRPASSVEAGSDEGKIVFSNFEAFTNSIKNLFRSKSATTKAGETKEITDRSSRKPKPSKPACVKTTKESIKTDEKKPKKTIFSGAKFAKPWPEHKIKFDNNVIKEKGYVRSERKNMDGINGYCFYKEDGSSRFIRVEMVLVQKMAHKI